MTTESKSKELAVLDEFKILEVYKYDVIERAAEAIETEVMSEVCDVTDPKGRERERSLAHKVSQAKSRVVKMANGSIEDARATVKAVTSERLRLEARFDEIRDKRKAASIDYEMKQELRRDRLKLKIAAIRAHVDLIDTTSEAIEVKLDSAESFDISEMEEYTPEAELVKAETIATLKSGLKVAMQREADAAKLKKLQDEAEKRKLEDEKRLAKEKADKLEADRKEQDRLDDIKAKEDADKAEEKRLADIEQAKKDAIEAERNRAKRAKEKIDLEAEKKAEEDRVKELAAECAELKRQADKDHRAKVREEIKEAISVNIRMTNVIPGDIDILIDAMERGEIPHVQINF